jgi:hypothetical protein
LVNLSPLSQEVLEQFYISDSDSGCIAAKILKTIIGGTFLKDLNA